MDCDPAHTDRFDAAVLLIKAVLIIFVFAAVLILLSARFQHALNDGRAEALVSLLNLSAPALVPSGRAARHPEIPDAGASARFSPEIFIPDPDPMRMVFRGTSP